MRVFSTLTLALCLAGTMPAAHADDVTRKAKAEEMLQLTKASPALQEQLGNLRTRVEDLAKQQFGPAPKTPAQTKLIDEYVKGIDGIISEEVGWDKLHPAIVQQYTDTFTEPELDGIIAFYKSPSGQALIAKTPALLNKTNALVTEHIKTMQPRLVALTKEYSDKVKAAEAPASAAPSLTTPAPKTVAPATPATK